MTITLRAKPLDPKLEGFYFTSKSDYKQKLKSHLSTYQKSMQEIDIVFIDGTPIDRALALAIGLNTENLYDYFDCLEKWHNFQKINAIIAMDKLGRTFDPYDDPADYNIVVYQAESLADLAESFVAEGLFGTLPPQFSLYIDYNAIAADLAADYKTIKIGDEALVYCVVS